MPYSCTFVFTEYPRVKRKEETRFITVMMMGRTFTVRPATVSIPSGLPRSAIGPKETPCSRSRFDRKRYATIKKGISSSSEVAPRRTYVGL